MNERNEMIEQIKNQIQQRVVAIYGKDCARKNEGEIDTLAAMVERVRRLEVPAFEPLNPDAGR